jgi:hypothetical protein
MKKATTKVVRAVNSDMRAEYDFTDGMRGKHHKAMQAGYTITIYKVDGSTVVKKVKPQKGTVVLEPDVQSYFPDSESVNTALRSLIGLIPTKRKTITRTAQSIDAKRRVGLSGRSKSAGKTKGR